MPTGGERGGAIGRNEPGPSALGTDATHPPPASGAEVSALSGTELAMRPPAPAGLTALLSAPTEARLEWQGSTPGGAIAGYEVLCGKGVVARVSGTHADVAGLAPGRRYCCTVRAFDAAGNRSERSAAACLSAPDVTPPTSPTQVTAEARPAEVRLRWAPSADDVAVAGYEMLRGGAVVAAAAGTEASETGLRAAVEYCYAVRAYDAAGNRSAPAGLACATPPDVTPPSVPDGLSALAPSETEVVLRWSPSSDDVGVAGYEVFRGDALVASGAETRASDAGLRAGTEYCYVVRAHDAAGNRSPRSGPACISTPDLTPPTAPGSVVATAGPGYEASIAWSASSDNVGVAGYEVFRGETPIATVTGTAAGDRGLRAAEQYCYAVLAFDAAGNRSPRSPPSCIVPPDVTPPSLPPQLTARATSEREIQVRWGAATDNVAVTGYELIREGVLVTQTPETSATVSGLRAATEYCYSVRARDAAGNRSKASGPVCATTPDLTPPTTPGAPAATATSDRQIDLRWIASMDNVGVAGYEVYRVVGGETVRPERLVARTEGTAASVSGLEPARRYCYAIVAYDAAGNRSSPAAPACSTTPDLTPPTAPEDLVAAASSGREVLLGWEASKDDVGVAGYEVLRAGAVVSTVGRTQAADGGLQGLTEYCYAVRAFDAAGNRSKPSATVCVKTLDPSFPAGPTRLRAEAIVAREVVLHWDPSPDPGVHYVVYWDRKGWKRIGVTPLTTYKVFGPTARELHCYRVSSQNAEGRESQRMPELCTNAGQGPPSARAQ